MSDDEHQETQTCQTEDREEDRPQEERKKEEEKKEEPRKEPEKKPEPKREPQTQRTEPKREPQTQKAEPKKEESKASKQSEKESDEQTGAAAATGRSKKSTRSRSDTKSAPDKSETSDGRSRQREFFKEELKRLQQNLKRESSKIVEPSRRKYTPFVFNTLEPYYNTHTTRYLIELPDESEQVFTFASRNTAQGLTDPWIDLRMDQEILPHIPSRPSTRHDPKSRRGKKPKKSAQEPNRKEGSTRLPKFPVVTLETKELATKQLYYSDVPMLRKELKTKYSSQARNKVEADYRRTQQDFYRMDLDRLDQVAPSSRRHLTSTYVAYLQNTPGSRRAVNECVRSLEGKAN